MYEPQVTAAAQHAGIRELIRLAELQEQAYARNAAGLLPGRHRVLRYAVPPARRPVDDQAPAPGTGYGPTRF